MRNIFIDIADSIAIVTINRPPVNTLNSEAYFEIYEAMYNLSINDDVRVVILTGAGEKSFVAGADVKEFVKFNSETGLIYTKQTNQIREFIRTYNKPIICGINGYSLGGGCILALMCDIRIASENATFALSEINMGILGGTAIISKIATSGVARKMVYSGESIKADEALRIGLVDEVVPFDSLLERCLALAKKISKKSPLAIKEAKACMVKASESSLEESMAFEEKSIRKLWGTQEKNEAISAFLEKREPKF